MANIIVIDGLARSGTTLLTAILNSQPSCAAYRGVFHEPIACRYTQWGYGYATHALLPENTKIHTKNNLRVRFFDNNLHLDQSTFFREALSRIRKRKQYSHISENEWIAMFDQVKFSTIEDVDSFYQDLANRIKINNLFLRWNNGHSYVSQWLNRKNHFWIIPIRHPVARAYSYLRSHDISYDQSLDMSVSFAKNMEMLKQRNTTGLEFTYYEDLLVNGIEEIRRILSSIGIYIDDLQMESLVDSSGKSYRVETSDIVDKGGVRAKGEKYKGLNQDKLNDFESKVAIEIQLKFEEALKNFPIYQRYY